MVTKLGPLCKVKLSYRRGCQGKNSSPPLRGAMDVVACIQPRLSSGGGLVLVAFGSPHIPARQAQLIVPTRRFHDALVVSTPSAPEAAQAKRWLKLPTMILWETRGLQLFWVVRGAVT